MSPEQLEKGIALKVDIDKLKRKIDNVQKTKKFSVILRTENSNLIEEVNHFRHDDYDFLNQYKAFLESKLETLDRKFKLL